MKNFFYTIFLSFIIFGGIQVFASDNGIKDNVLIYANKNGEARGYDLKWKAENITGTYAQESPVLRKDGVLYVSSLNRGAPQPGNRSIFALDANTGSVIAQYETGGSFGDARIDGDTLYIGTGNETWDPDPTWTGSFGMYSFDISNIRTNGFILNWFHDVPARIASNILIDNNNIYFTEFTGDKLLALAKNDGHQVWAFTKGSNAAIFSMLKDGYIYLANSRNPAPNLLYKIRASDGTLIWSKPIIGNLWDNSITYSPEKNAFFFTAYFDGAGSGRHRAVSYDINGNFLWEYELHDRSLSYTSYHSGVVFFSDLSGWVYALDADTGVLKWENQIGKGIHKSVDIASPVISNGKIFIGTKGSGWYNADTRGRGAFYILDEETGNIIWTYHEADLGDIMSLATVVDGVFYNATNMWDVYAFDVGDGTSSDHTNSTYDTNNTFSTETGLTYDRYVKLNCSNTGVDTLCDTSNLYTGKAVNVKIDMDTDIIQSVLLQNGNYHINVDGSYVYMPEIAPNSTLQQTSIKSDTALVYDNTIPRLKNIQQSNAAILEASYVQTKKRVNLRVDGVSSFNAEIENFSRPFLGTTSILDNSSVILSKTGINGEVSIPSVNMLLNESSGNNEVYIYTWENSLMKWTEKGSDASNISSHIIEGLIPNKKYILDFDGDKEEFFADVSGVISFNKNIGNTLHTFSLSPFKRKSRDSIHYVCKDSKAINYNKFGRHKASLCEYKENKDITEEDNNIQESNSVTNPFGGDVCEANLLIHNNMKKGDKNGKYSSYNKGIVTEVALLQKHINRILKDEYKGQVAGPEDGIFGKLTKRGVERLQRKLNQLLPEMKPLVVDGIVGPFTKQAINRSC